MTAPEIAKPRACEWPTLLVCALCYGGVGLSTGLAGTLGAGLSITLLMLSLTLYASFNHEVLHGHPFRHASLNMALVFPAMGLVIPYLRFRDTHLAHHHDPSLTDPYDDPESNFVDPAIWTRWSPLRRKLYDWNNTLLGRMAIGPAIGLVTFYTSDLRAFRAGDRRILPAYLLHALGLLPVLVWLAWLSEMSVWHYGLAVYGSLSLLKIRTFLEHRAHEKPRCRSVIVEDRGLLAFLFLNNNLHAVHHGHPHLPWYCLPERYAAQSAEVLRRNGGYVYRSYLDVARRFLLQAKDPVPHSLLPGGREPLASHGTGSAHIRHCIRREFSGWIPRNPLKHKRGRCTTTEIPPH